MRVHKKFVYVSLFLCKYCHHLPGRKHNFSKGLMRIIAERTLEIDEELCVCYIDWQKAFDHVNWTKLMQILKRTGIDWHERRLISKLYVDQRVKVKLDRGETSSVQILRGVRQECCLSLILFNLYSECLSKKLWMGLETSTLEGKYNIVVC